MSLYSATILRDKPLAYWRLGEISGDPQDLSGYGHDAAKNGTITYGVAGALFGDTDTAMTFDGSTGYIQTAYSSAFDLTNFSVECWFKIAGASANAGLFCKTVGGAVNTQYQFFIEAGNLKLRIFSGVTQYTIGTATPSLGVWHHAVGTYDPTGTGTMRVYLDGIQTDVSGAPVPTPNTGNGVSFIGALNGSTYLLPGQEDEVALYGSTLTVAQVVSHYNAGLAGANFQTALLDRIAQVVGGTNVSGNQPRFFSGDQVGDGTGLQAGVGYPSFKGCYSAPPEAIEDVPVGIVLVGPFQNVGPKSQDVYVQGVEHAIDDLRLLILISRSDAETDITNLMPYRDLVPAAFAAKMTAFSASNVLQVMCRAGKPITTTVAGIPYNGMEFTLRMIRSISRQYTS